jgi:hypothetical protein
MSRAKVLLLALVVCLAGTLPSQAAEPGAPGAQVLAAQPLDSLFELISGRQSELSLTPIDQPGLPLLLNDNRGGGPDSACHGWTTCPSPKLCGAWSTYGDCDSPCCGYDSYCEGKGLDATVQPRERFRICTLGNGSSCTEWQTWSFRLYCGCGGGGGVPAC